MAPQAAATIGEHFRSWRERHRFSQLHCALEANISQRHLSFLETGRSRPSRDMVIHLADRLNIPLRERNEALLAAGYAPAYSERPLDDPEMASALGALNTLLAAYEPNPALAVDRHWHIVHANKAVSPLLEGVSDPALLAAPVNVLRLSLHPAGLAPLIENLETWRAHLMHRLERQIAVTRDAILIELRNELLAFNVPGKPAETLVDPSSVLVPLRLKTGAGTLSFISTTTVFGTPRDVILSELAIEAFLPVDRFTANYLAHQRAADSVP